MTVLLEGNGRFDFRIHTGRIEYDAIAGHIDEPPPEGLNMDCVAMIVLDDRHVTDPGNGVAAGVMLRGPKTVPAGWFQWKQAREYRQEIAALGVQRSDAVLCRGRLRGGSEVQFRKGPMRMCFNLWLDLDWPIRVNSDWYAACAPYLRQSEG